MQHTNNTPKIDRELMRIARSRIDELLAELGVEMGLNMKLGNGTFDHDGVTGSFKLQLVAPNSNGDILDERAQDYLRLCKQFDAKEEWLGTSRIIPGKGSCKLVGLNRRAQKFPLILELPSGERYKFTETVLKYWK